MPRESLATGIDIGQQLLDKYIEIAQSRSALDEKVATQEPYEQALESSLYDVNGMLLDPYRASEDRLEDVARAVLLTVAQREMVSDLAKEHRKKISRAYKFFTDNVFGNLVTVEAIVPGTTPIVELGPSRRSYDRSVVQKRHLDKVTAWSVMPRFVEGTLMLGRKRGFTFRDIIGHDVKVLDSDGEPVVRIAVHKE